MFMLLFPLVSKLIIEIMLKTETAEKCKNKQKNRSEEEKVVFLYEEHTRRFQMVSVWSLSCIQVNLKSNC